MSEDDERRCSAGAGFICGRGERIREEGKGDDWSERVIRPHGIGIQISYTRKKQHTINDGRQQQQQQQ